DPPPQRDTRDHFFPPPEAAPTPVTHDATRPYLWMLAGSLAFALMASTVRLLAPYCDWQLLAVLRSAMALAFAVGLAPAAAVRPGRWLWRWPWRGGRGRGWCWGGLGRSGCAAWPAASAWSAPSTPSPACRSPTCSP